MGAAPSVGHNKKKSHVTTLIRHSASQRIRARFSVTRSRSFFTTITIILFHNRSGSSLIGAEYDKSFRCEIDLFPQARTSSFYSIDYIISHDSQRSFYRGSGTLRGSINKYEINVILKQLSLIWMIYPRAMSAITRDCRQCQQRRVRPATTNDASNDGRW